jgi:hypothetical protein
MKGEKPQKRPSFDIRIVLKPPGILLKFGSCGQKSEQPDDDETMPWQLSTK